jgi:hypothetical protein
MLKLINLDEENNQQNALKNAWSKKQNVLPQQAKIINNYNTTRVKLLKANAAIWFNNASDRYTSLVTLKD